MISTQRLLFVGVALLGSFGVAFAQSGAGQIHATYSVYGNSFSDMNHSMAGLFMNNEMRDQVVQWIRQDIRDGADPDQIMNTAFAPYVAKAQEAYLRRGIRLIPDPSLTELDTTLAIYRATQGSGIPFLKPETDRAHTSETLFENRRYLDHVDIHLYMDMQYRSRMLQRLGQETFDKIYGEDVRAAQENPIVRNLLVTADEEGGKKATEYFAALVPADAKVQVDVIPNQNLTVSIQYANGSNFNFNLIPGTNLRVSGTRPDPEAPRILPQKGTILLEVPQNEVSQLFPGTSNLTFGSTNLTMVSVPLTEVTLQQLARARKIHVSVSDYVALQNKLSRPAGDNIPSEARAILSNFEEHAYKACR